MAEIIPERVSAEIEGDFIVFLIGMRVNAWWKVHKWWPVAMAMRRMQAELHALPVEESGCMVTSMSSPGVTIQYWRSFEHLEAYARETSGLHMEAWKKFNVMAKKARGDVGIYHETFLVKAGNYETLYSGMPVMGLGKAGTVVPATGHMKNARGRLTGTDQPEGSASR